MRYRTVCWVVQDHMTEWGFEPGDQALGLVLQTLKLPDNLMLHRVSWKEKNLKYFTFLDSNSKKTTHTESGRNYKLLMVTGGSMSEFLFSVSGFPEGVDFGSSGIESSQNMGWISTWIRWAEIGGMANSWSLINARSSLGASESRAWGWNILPRRWGAGSLAATQLWPGRNAEVSVGSQSQGWGPTGWWHHPQHRTWSLHSGNSRFPKAWAQIIITQLRVWDHCFETVTFIYLLSINYVPDSRVPRIPVVMK